MARTGWLDPELSPQQLLDRELSPVDMLTPLYAELDAAAAAVTQPKPTVILQAVNRSSTT